MQAIQEQTAQRLRGEQRARHADAVAASDALAKAANAQDSLANYGRLVVVLRTAGERCDSAFAAESLAVSSCTETRALLETRIDTLEHALNRQLKVGQCKFLGIRCPSRTQALAGGLLVGGLTGVWLAK